MGKISQFIETIQSDEKQWITVRVKPTYHKYLKHEKCHTIIRRFLIDSLKDNLITVQVEPHEVKVKVKSGTEAECIKRIETQLAKHLGNPLKLMKLLR